jgi:HJR/Mrr/RecB family endonuclease
MEKLHEFYKYDRKLEVNSNSLVEFFTREGENIFADWRISWYDINEITYREDTRVGTSFLGFPLFFSGDQPSIIISLKKSRPFRFHKNFKLHTDSHGQQFYRSPDGRLLPTNVIEISGYDSLSQIHNLLKDHMEELANQEQMQLEELTKNEIIRQQQERQYFQRINRLEDIQKIDPIQFEKLVSSLFKKLGYDVLLTKASGDEGIDLILSKDGKKSVVQCKRYSGTVGQPIARDLYGSMIHNRAEDAYLITTGVFSLPAQTWASGKPIHLVDGKMWIETILGKDGIG